MWSSNLRFRVFYFFNFIVNIHCNYYCFPENKVTGGIEMSECLNSLNCSQLHFELISVASVSETHILILSLRNTSSKQPRSATASGRDVAVHQLIFDLFHTFRVWASRWLVSCPSSAMPTSNGT